MLRSIKRRPLLHGIIFALPTALVVGVVAASVGFDVALLYVIPFTLAIGVVFAVTGYYVSRLVNRLLGLDPWF
jgi:hypothetical protein